MIFSGELPAKVLSGEKTDTRRLPSDNPRSPWWRERCAYKVGRDYAVVPGRGKHAIGRIRIIDVQLVPLGRLTIGEARREGFASPSKFALAWLDLHGVYRPDQLVWRVEFEAIKGGNDE